MWPYHPEPLPDELLSSWLTRIAIGNGLKTQDFARAALRGSIWSYDIDVFAAENVLRALAVGTETPVARARDTKLARFDASGVTRKAHGGVPDWVMPVSGGPRKRRLFGLQCCIHCLSMEPGYFRRVWRLAFVTVCGGTERA